MREAEDAISHFAPHQPDERLFTGNRDLTGIENAVNELLEKVHQSYQQQIRFVSDASHELRTPISVIQGYANMLGRWGKEDEAILDESIHAIQTESEHMKKLVEQLLFLARGDSGRNPLKMEELKLDELAQEVYEETCMIDPDHRWQIKVQPGVQTWGDNAMIKQALRILVDNARKYTPQGEEIELRAYRNENNAPCLEVQDHGIGMSQEDADHIFERFYRADEARSKGGSGLGLSIAKWIVDRHGGHFEVLSRESLGTRMTMVFNQPTGENTVGE
jgi:signal transduction histidine kinase